MLEEDDQAGGDEQSRHPDIEPPDVPREHRFGREQHREPDRNEPDRERPPREDEHEIPQVVGEPRELGGPAEWPVRRDRPAQARQDPDHRADRRSGELYVRQGGIAPF